VIHSMQFRLLVAFALVILVTVGAVYFFVNQTTKGEIRRFGERSEMARFFRVEHELQRYYREHGEWEGIQPFVAQWESLYQRRIIVTDPDGLVVADSQGELLGEHYHSDMPGKPLSPPWEADVPGRLYITPGPSTDFPSPGSLAHAVSRFLLWGGLLAVAIALLITVFLSRKILAPVKALTLTARRLGRGDFSQRINVQDKGEIGELAQAFNSMAGDLERAEQLRRNMVADVAHELRTPLTNLKGYLEAVRDGVKKPDAETIAMLHDEASLLSRLIDELQELSLVEAGELKLNCQAEDISMLINQVVMPVQLQAAEKEVSLSVDLPDNLPPVCIDSQRVSLSC